MLHVWQQDGHFVQQIYTLFTSNMHEKSIQQSELAEQTSLQTFHVYPTISNPVLCHAIPEQMEPLSIVMSKLCRSLTGWTCLV